MGERTQAQGWDRPEVNLRLTKRRVALLRAALGSTSGSSSPTEAIDVALEAAARSARQEDEADGLREALEAGLSSQGEELRRLEAAVASLAKRIDGLCALIAEVAESES